MSKSKTQIHTFLFPISHLEEGFTWITFPFASSSTLNSTHHPVTFQDCAERAAARENLGLPQEWPKKHFGIGQSQKN